MDARSGRAIRHLHFRDAEVSRREVVHKTLHKGPVEADHKAKRGGWPLGEDHSHEAPKE